MVVGSQGVTLNYVIWEVETSDYDEALCCKEAGIQTVRLGGAKFNINKKIVHEIILNNVHEGLNIYTYVKPSLCYKDEQKDVIALDQH